MAMLLQMVFEKIAKAVLARSDFRALEEWAGDEAIGGAADKEQALLRRCDQHVLT